MEKKNMKCEMTFDVLVNGKTKTRSCTFNKAEVTIGSGGCNDIIINGTCHKQAIIRFEDFENIWLQDIGDGYDRIRVPGCDCNYKPIGYVNLAPNKGVQSIRIGEAYVVLREVYYEQDVRKKEDMKLNKISLSVRSGHVSYDGNYDCNRIHVFEKDSITIGSHADGDIVLPNLAPLQAEIFYKDGFYYIKDIVRNGMVLVNDRKADVAKLFPGARIEVGFNNIRVESMAVGNEPKEEIKKPYISFFVPPTVAPLAKKTYVLYKENFTIGGSVDDDIFVPHTQPGQAEVVFIDGYWFVRSTRNCGLLVNGELIRYSKLHLNSYIDIGHTRLVVGSIETKKEEDLKMFRVTNPAQIPIGPHYVVIVYRYEDNSDTIYKTEHWVTTHKVTLDEFVSKISNEKNTKYTIYSVTGIGKVKTETRIVTAVEF